MSAGSFRAACSVALLGGLSALGCAPTAVGGRPGSDGGSSGPKCGSTPTQLVDLNALATQVGATGIGAMQLAVDSTNVYFVFGGALRRVPIRGGAASMMLPLLPQVGQNCDPIATPTSVLLHHVISGNANDEQVVSVPLHGGSATVLATSIGVVRGLATDGHGVYFVDSAGLESVPVAGGSVQLLSDAVGSVSATGLAVVGSNLVATGGNAVLSVPIQGGPATALGGQQPNAEFPMACGSDTCWWTGAPPSAMGPTGPGYIARLAGGSVTMISAPVYPWSLTFDGTNFFETVGCDVCSGTLVRIPLSGAPAVTMATAGFVAVDDECAYFSVLAGFDLPSAVDGGIPGTGIYSVTKSYADPALAETSGGTGGAQVVDSGTGGCPGSSDTDAGSESEGGAACDAPCDGTCVGGRCLVMLASGTNNANGMAIDSENLYWTEFPAGNVKKVALDGGSVITLASGQPGPLGIVANSTSVYWTGESEVQTGALSYTQTGTVTKAALDGGSPTTLASGQSNPNSVAVDSTSIYWTNGGTVMCDCGSVMKAALDGGSATTLASGRSLASGIAIDSTSVYWTEGTGGTVLKVPLDGGSLTTLASEPSTSPLLAGSIAVDGTSAYWTNSGGGTVMKVALDGGTPTTLASGQCSPAGIAVDESSVYWTNSSENGNNGTVMKVALDGSGMTTLATGQSYPNSIAVDSTSVYWANLVGDTLMKLTPK